MTGGQLFWRRHDARWAGPVCGRAEAKLGPSSRKVNVVITIPYPCHNQACFGKFSEEGKRLNFSILKQDLVAATEQRLDAVEWFVEQAVD